MVRKVRWPQDPHSLAGKHLPSAQSRLLRGTRPCSITSSGRGRHTVISRCPVAKAKSTTKAAPARPALSLPLSPCFPLLTLSLPLAMPVVKRAVASPIMRPQPPPSTQRRRAVPRAADSENMDIVPPTPTGTSATRSLKPQSSTQVLTEHVLNNSPGRTPKARGPPKAPPVERNDGFRYMTEAEVRVRAGTRDFDCCRVTHDASSCSARADGGLVLL